MPEQRKAILERMAGHVVEKVERRRVNGRTVERVKEETEGGILHWGRENGPDLDWFRSEIRKAYDGRAPKVLDPFAGGGAIPLEAMRLGCEVTAMDINPVAWFILKCTLEYPQRLAGQTRPLPTFALEDRDFMEKLLKDEGVQGRESADTARTAGPRQLATSSNSVHCPRTTLVTEADLAWHVRAWGRWVLAKARKELTRHYPTYAEFEPLASGRDYEPRPMRLLEVDEDGIPQIDPLNAALRWGLHERPDQPALGRQADGGLSLGADRAVQAVQGRAAPAQDALAVQEGQQARSPDDGTER